jgi:sulfite reductase alpha subunit-like flavoprotein
MVKTVLFALAALHINVILAFTPSYQPKTSDVQLSASKDRVKQVGGGIPIIESGGCQLFDPEEEGKLQGTGALSQRISQGSQYSPYVMSSDETIISSMSPPSHVTVEAQHWLEHLETPVNFAKPNKPVKATVLGKSRIITEDAPGDIQHVIMRLPDGMHYVEGQSLSVIPPGTDAKGKKYSPRLYSIASTRYGDALDGNTVSLCVRRAEYYDPETGKVDPAKKGVCSNFLCDAERGLEVDVAGPVGKTMLLPKDPDADVIMVATGTGIAPFRGFLHRLFVEETVSKHMFGGKAWLVLGVPVTGGLLYKEELDFMMQNGELRGIIQTFLFRLFFSRDSFLFIHV